MTDYYKLSSTTNRHTDWTTEVVLERDDQGNPTRSVRAGEPVELSGDDRKKLESLGYKLESSSKQEAEQFQASATQVAGSDIGGAAPLMGDSEAADQAEAEESNETSESRKSGSKSKSSDKN